MRTVSDQYQQLLEKKTDFYPEATITFLGGKEETLTKKDFTLYNNSIIQSAGSTSLPLGNVVSKQITIELSNDNGRWNDYDFYGAKIFLQTKFDLLDGSTETINEGTFTVLTPETYGETVIISAMDDGYKLDVDYSTKLSYPLSVADAVRDSCESCGVSLLTTTFTNSDFVIKQAPEGLTHRQFIGYCAMIAGGNACFNERNFLKFITYDFSVLAKLYGLNGGYFDKENPDKYMSGDEADGGSFDPWDDGYTEDGGQFGDRKNIQILHNFINLKVETDDVVVTGIRIQVGETQDYIQEGTDGYILSLKNTLANGSESELASKLKPILIGAKFRPFVGDHIAYPLAELMDVVIIEDRRGNMYPAIITDIDFTYNGITTLKCSADSPIRNSSKYNSSAVESIVKNQKAIDKEKTDREKAIENLAGTLANSSGLYMTKQQQEDQSYIYYMHNKPSLEESDIIWKLTAEAFAISTDGGDTYPYGFTIDGELITRLLYAEGINADYIKTGTLKIMKGDKVIFLADCDTGRVEIVADSFSMSSGRSFADVDQAAQDALTTAQNAQNLQVVLSNEYEGVPTDVDGNYQGTLNIQTSVSAYFGKVNVTNSCTFTPVPSDGVVGNWNNEQHIYTVTQLTTDSGYVDITAKYQTEFTITKRFNISKVKQGQTGAQGEDGQPGEDGTAYFLEANVASFSRTSSGYLDPSNITVTLYMRKGTGEKEKYTVGPVYIAFYTGTEAGTFTRQNTVNSNSNTFSLSSKYENAAYLRFIASSNSTPTIENAIDYITIPVLTETKMPELTHEQIFNLLTDNGRLQGLYEQNNELYINATYIKSGILKLGGQNETYGQLYVIGSDNNLYARFASSSIITFSYQNTTGDMQSTPYIGVDHGPYGLMFNWIRDWDPNNTQAYRIQPFGGLSYDLFDRDGESITLHSTNWLYLRSSKGLGLDVYREYGLNVNDGTGYTQGQSGSIRVETIDGRKTLKFINGIMVTAL